VAAAEKVHRGEANDLIERLAADRDIGIERSRLEQMLSPAAMVGRAPDQVEKFIVERVDPLLESQRSEIDKAGPQLVV
jgi:adenylosuccinate lyase